MVWTPQLVESVFGDNTAFSLYFLLVLWRLAQTIFQPCWLWLLVSNFCYVIVGGQSISFSKLLIVIAGERFGCLWLLLGDRVGPAGYVVACDCCWAVKLGWRAIILTAEIACGQSIGLVGHWDVKVADANGLKVQKKQMFKSWTVQGCTDDDKSLSSSELLPNRFMQLVP